MTDASPSQRPATTSSHHYATSPHIASSATTTESILGIWRVGQTIHQSDWANLSLAQPADSIGSPRWDYVIKSATSNDVEAARQISSFVVAASSVMHPNLVAVLDSSIDSQSPYLVMPRLEGQTLADRLDSRELVPLPVALWFVRQIAQALEALHAAGWVHGDIKPENVNADSRGHVTLLDLGFATRVHTVGATHFRGTPQYSSPEAINGQHAAIPAMDVFSLGRILWEFMTKLEPISHVLLEPVADLVESMVTKSPDDRPTAREMVKRLLRLEIETLGQHIGPEHSKKAA